MDARGISAGDCLRRFLPENADRLQAIICSYVVRMGLAHDEDACRLAADVLNEAVVEALAHAERFDPDTRPGAWLLAIAAKKLERVARETTCLALLVCAEPCGGPAGGTAGKQLYSPVCLTAR
jgi:hypothetical protein